MSERQDFDKVPLRVTSRMKHDRGSLNQDEQNLENSDDIEDLLHARTVREDKVNLPPLPWFSVVIVLCVGFGFVYTGFHYNISLPVPLSIYNESTNVGKFIAFRALHHLNQLVSKKERVSGSYENEILGVDFLTREIGFIEQTALSIHTLSVDVQKSTDCAHMGAKYGYTNCYADVTNVAVHLSTVNVERSQTNSLLISCHFDSAPKSPGASTASHCAVMLEILQILSRSPEPLRHSVVFIFNGAKESYQQGALSFISKHPWAKHVKAFVNMDAFGVGGREILFQTGQVHSLLLEMYIQSAPHPHGLVLMEEAFSYFMADTTDYNIYADFGKIPGLGFANFMNGYVYRTAYDLPELIPAASLQHTGDNLLALVERIVYSEDLANMDDSWSTTPVYFDLFGLYMISYSECTAVAVNLVTIVFAALVFTREMNFLYRRYGDNALRKYFRRCMVANVTADITGILAACIAARIAALGGAAMSWYTNNWILYPLFFGPVITVQMMCALFLDRTRRAVIPRMIAAQVALLSQHLILVAFLLLGTIFNVRSSYLPMILLLLPSFAMYCMHSLYIYEPSKKWFIGFFTGLSLPLSIVIYHMVIFFEALIPVCGRLMQPTALPDTRLAIMAAVWCILITSYLTGLFILVRNAVTICCGFVNFQILLVLVLSFTSLITPFNVDSAVPTPQRLTIYHTERAFYNPQGHVKRSDYGYWVIPSDWNSANSLKTLIPKLQPIIELTNDCKEVSYCAMPVSDPSPFDGLPWSYWVKGGPPIIHTPTSIQLNKRKMISINVRRLEFTVHGPSHIVLLVSSSVDNKLIRWSFSNTVPLLSRDYSGNYVPALIVTYSRGMTEQPWQFWMDFQISEGNLTAISVNIAVVGHYMHPSQVNSEHLKEFLKVFPPWIDVTYWTSSYRTWSF